MFDFTFWLVLLTILLTLRGWGLPFLLFWLVNTHVALVSLEELTWPTIEARSGLCRCCCGINRPWEENSLHLERERERRHQKINWDSHHWSKDAGDTHERERERERERVTHQEHVYRNPLW